MRQENSPIRHESLASKAKGLKDKLTGLKPSNPVLSSPQLATEAVGAFGGNVDAENPKTESMLQARRLGHAHAGAGIGTGRGVTAPGIPQTDKGPLSKGAKIAFAGTAATVAAIAGVYGAYETIPQVRSAVESIIGGEKVPSTYDSKADHQIVQAGINATPVLENDHSIFQNVVEPLGENNKPNISMVLPIKLSQGQKIEISTVHADAFIDPETGAPTVLGKKIRVFEKDTESFVPLSNAEIFRLNYNDKFAGIVIKFEGPDGTYNLQISSSHMEDLIPLETIKDAPIRDFGVLNTEHGLPMPTGLSTFKTGRSDVDLSFTLVRVVPKSDGNGYKGKPIPFRFKQDEEGQTILYIPKENSITKTSMVFTNPDGSKITASW